MTGVVCTQLLQLGVKPPQHTVVLSLQLAGGGEIALVARLGEQELTTLVGLVQLGPARLQLLTPRREGELLGFGRVRLELSELLPPALHGTFFCPARMLQRMLHTS